MFVVMMAFSSVVIGLARYTDERVEANQALAFERAVVRVLPGVYEEGLSGLEIHRRFVEQVDEPTEATAGAYSHKSNGVVQTYALPFEGQGFWATIKGIIGIKADRETVTAISFYEQNETPGLGARITEPEFRDQFEGKVLAADGKTLTFRRPGETLTPSQVHAVTGATQTSVRLEKIVNDAVAQWREQLSGESRP